MDTPASDLERLRALRGDLERNCEAFDLKIAIDSCAHEIRLRSMRGYRKEEKKKYGFNHTDTVRMEEREWFGFFRKIIDIKIMGRGIAS